MFRKAINSTGIALGITLTSMAFSLPAHAYQDGYSGMGSGNGSGMGMDMGSGSGYENRSGYYGTPGYGYQRPPMPPYGYQRPPMPPMRPYGYQRPPMAPIRPYGQQRKPMKPMRPYGYGAAPMVPPAAAGAGVTSKPNAASTAATVNISGMAFGPSSLTVKAGTTVTWINNDSTPHTVTSMDSGPLASDSMSRGQSYSMAFAEPGTYTYYCKFHPNMRASINVE